MTLPDAPALQQFTTALDASRALPTDVGALRQLGDADLLAAVELHTATSRALEAAGSALAGEIAFRSRPALGSEGLARRTGHRTPANLIKAKTGATKEQVITVLATGNLLTEIANEGTPDLITGELQAPTKPWLRAVASAVTAGSISASASQSIARGLGEPNSAVTIELLEKATATLVSQAVAGIDADRLWRNARDLRNEMDLEGIKIQEVERWKARGISHFPLPTGGGRAIITMDTEGYAQFIDYFDRMTSPKRGGVRFVDKSKAERAKAIEQDERTPAQLAYDGFFHLLATGAEADGSVMLGTGAAVIRITVAETALQTGIGFGRIDGMPEPISIDSVKRLMESGKSLRMAFNPNGTYIEAFDDPVAENRLFNRKQREILAAKFGGCMDPDCDRPPSWTEAHHIRFVKRDGGKTTICNAIPLCKFHHLKYHNEGYEVVQDDFGDYWKIPPVSVDPRQTPIAMPLKTRNLNDLWAAEQRAAS